MYLYEQLGDDRFQKLAQSLLATVFPNTQCLPVNQPDGGRDGFVRLAESTTGAIIFQVKFSARPQEKAEREALVSFVKTERDKVAKLKARGATAYYLITNVAGTAHLDAGSIDRLNDELSAELDLPSYCWWRDDIDARINANADVKWSFPEIMRGTDVLQLLFEALDRDHADIRRAALRAYITSQHIDDAQVKFKQVEIQNKLIDLFVDIPVGPSEGAFRGLRPHHFVFEDDAGLNDSLIVRSYYRENGPDAAAFLLNQRLADGTRRLVVEGAPGQGKSTITQYICQVNRLRLLGSPELNHIPVEHARSPVRVPFRIDLRDFAAWLSGRDPFAADQNTRLPPQTVQSLENLIATQVANASGGHAFHVADLVAILKESHALIVLDGFDEVADIPLRQRLVEEIGKAAARLSANAKSVMLIVTSRPAAFANSPGFPEREWQHFSLQAMTRQQIELYAKKWTEARNMAPSEARDIQVVLSDKLGQSHMRDLATNPMQLAILLSLISTRGMSLPDKRTALYDNYMELFFSREAEKSAIVRDQRDLLVSIHRYLAWILQTEAETAGGTGSISDARLRGLLTTYLEAEGHETDIVEDLFHGMKERVGALVSRVQDTYEFEVQPLREYFAARYLYETAPNSPIGDEVRGTKLERFDALVRNFYWLNTTRFYCGCYSAGELGSLADGLEELNKTELYGLLSHSRSLAVMLLGDWVFSQRPHVVNRVLDEALEEPGLTLLLANDSRAERGIGISLPDRCGRKELVARLIKILSPPSAADRRSAAARLLLANTDSAERLSIWQSMSGGPMREWLWLGSRLKVFDAMPSDTIFSLSRELSDQVVGPLASARRWDAIYSDDKLFEGAVRAALKGAFWGRPDEARLPSPPVQQLAWLLSPFAYRPVFQRDSFDRSRSLRSVWGMKEASTFPCSEDVLRKDGKVASFIEELGPLYEVGNQTWKTQLAPWSTLLDQGIKTLGPGQAFVKVALLGASITASDEAGRWDSESWKISPGLCDRLRFARLKSGNAQWWRDQLNLINSEDDSFVAGLTFALFATPRTIKAVGGVASDLFEKMCAGQLASVTSVFGEVFDIIEPSGKLVGGGSTEGLSESVGAPLAFFVSRRARYPHNIDLYARCLADYRGSNREIASHCSMMALRQALGEPGKWEKALEAARYAHSIGAHVSFIGDAYAKMPAELARQVCREAGFFPLGLVRGAERRLASSAGSRAPKLGDVAREQTWFE